jgi:serine/threonine protein kinase
VKGITHRDIKPDNILLGENSHHGGECGIFLRLADFGMSKPLSRNFPSTPGCVTALYRAPEIVMGIDYDNKSDMWSVGCVLFEMIAGGPFIRTDTNKDLIIYRDIMSNLPNEPDENVLIDMWSRTKVQRMSSSGIRPMARQTLEERTGMPMSERTMFDTISPNNTMNFFALMNALLCIDPYQRPSATEALNMPFFAPMRSYIDTVRERNPIVPDKFTTTIIRCNERTWIASIVAGIVNKSEEHKWYTHRIMFHSISLFDKYLAWADRNVPKNTKPSDSVGMFHSSKDVSLYYFVCLYISYKYFLSIESVNYSWNEFVTSAYATNDMMMRAKVIEEHIIEKVLEYKIYNLNMIEIPEQRGFTLDANLIQIMLQGYLKLHETFTGTCSIDELFDAIVHV